MEIPRNAQIIIMQASGDYAVLGMIHGTLRARSASQTTGLCVHRHGTLRALSLYPIEPVEDTSSRLVSRC